MSEKSVAVIPFEQVRMMAVDAAKSSLFGVSTPEQAITLMLLCQAEGLHPMDALRRYHIIKGRPSMRSDAMLAEYRRRGGRVKWVERTERVVEAIFTNPDGDVSPPIRWDDARLKQAGLNSGNHLAYPMQMKTARVISEGVRLMMPEIVAGIYTPEEIQDVVEVPHQMRRAENVITVPTAETVTLLDAIAGYAADDPRLWQRPQPDTTETRLAILMRRAEVGPIERFPEIEQRISQMGNACRHEDADAIRDVMSRRSAIDIVVEDIPQ